MGGQGEAGHFNKKARSRAEPNCLFELYSSCGKPAVPSISMGSQTMLRAGSQGEQCVPQQPLLRTHLPSSVPSAALATALAAHD